MAITAAHCTKTLFIAASVMRPLRTCVKLLLPALIEFISKVAPQLDDDSMSEQCAAALDEILRAFAALLTMAADDQRAWSQPSKIGHILISLYTCR